MSTAAKMLEELKIKPSDWNLRLMEEALRDKEHTSFVLREERISMHVRTYTHVTVFADANKLPRGNMGSVLIFKEIEHDTLGKVIWTSIHVDSSD